MIKETIPMTGPALPEQHDRSTSARRLWSALAAALVFLLLVAASARADLLEPGGFSVTTTSDQAGAHADITTKLAFVSDSSGVTSEDAKDIVVDLPVGFTGEPASLPRCSLPLFTQGIPLGSPGCPTDTQVGSVTLTLSTGVVPTLVTVPVYNLVPDSGQTTKFGFSAQGVYGIQAVISVRPSDYGLRTIIHNTSEEAYLDASSLTLWGVPADPSHDPLRGAICINGNCFTGGLTSGLTRAPFLSNPTHCGTPLTATLHADSWENRGRQNVDGSPDFSDPTWQSASSQIPAMTGCDSLSFEPTIAVTPSVTQASSPSGYTVDLSVPQNNNPDSVRTPDLRKAIVTLPEGVTLSPPAADGLEACTDTQLGLGSNDQPTCPPASKIGTATLTTPALPDQLTGGIYLAGPPTGPITDPPYRIFLAVAGDGVRIKLQGSVQPDLSTGQLVTTFDDNPEQPFSDLKLQFKSGPRAPLANPTSCGTFTTTSALTPWSSPSTPDSTPTSAFDITGCGDPNRFAPSFSAGVTNPQAGASSPFTLAFSRDDADQQFSHVSVALPPGLLAKVAGVPLCSDADANVGSCPAGSQVGTATTGAGPGSDPLFLTGKAYLTGPYKGAPYGLAVVVPAIAGPFDLGNVVVRQAIQIDPHDAHVTVTSDPFPTILKGIPLEIRTVNVTLDRQGFMVNPTSCAPMRVDATLASLGGQSAPVGSRFQVGGCSGLRFSPTLRLTLSGRHQTTDGKHPTLRANLTQPSGQANIKGVRVTLPLSLALDPANSQHVCSVADAAKDACPASTKIGAAQAVTPLLDKPLNGSVFLVQGIRTDAQGRQHKTLPTLLVPLRGQIALDLRAQTSVVRGALVTTFGTIPDAAVKSFRLTINGGSKGIIVVTHNQNICAGAQRAVVTEAAQNGRRTRRGLVMGTPCRHGQRRSH